MTESMHYPEKYMYRCLELARKGLGTTYPNPMVGSVIVYQDKVIGEGWHRKAGEPHAEVNAINSVKDKRLLPQSTIYVSLEPCSHYGKTPPCADLILQHNIPKVVIGTTDPFAKVCGRGISKLKEAGCEVIVGVLEKECQELNKRFFTFHNRKRPYIFLKWAETRNGYIAPIHKQQTAPMWITKAYAQQYVHQLRSEEQAILVGTNTVLADNPKLNTRHWFGKNPLRIVIDAKLKIPQTFAVYDDTQETLFLTEEVSKLHLKNTSFQTIDFSESLPKQVCDLLYQKQIQSLIVEGGSMVLQQFIDANLWDEALIFVGDTSFAEGIKAPYLPNKNLVEVKEIGTDKLFIYKNLLQ